MKTKTHFMKLFCIFYNNKIMQSTSQQYFVIIDSLIFE